MRILARSVMVACAAVTLFAFARPAGAPGAHEASPAARGVWKCRTDSPSHQARLWWNEARNSEHTIPEVFEKPGATTYTPPPTDGRCATQPAIVKYLAARIDALLRRDRALSMPHAASDTGMPATWGDPSRIDSRIVDGGSGAVDFYLDAARSVADDRGVTSCVHWYPLGQGSARSRTAAFVTLYAVRPFSQVELDRIVHDTAHELVHVLQCAVTNRSGSVNGTTLDLSLVEGSAEAYALASSGFIDASTLARAIRTPGPVLASAARSTGDPYSRFPFWYELFGAPSAKRYVALLRSAVAAPPAEHRQGDANLVYRAFGETAVQRALIRFASVVVLGGDIGGVRYDPPWEVSVAALAQLAPSSGAPTSSRVRLQQGAYGYLVVAWAEGVTELTVATTGVAAARAAEAVAAGTREGGQASPTGSVWHLSRDCDAAGRCNGDGKAYITVANGRRTPLALTVTVTAP